ncbi:MAG: hypothetical protein NC411_10850 [Bacteroides sp.]|nr:hypothetical protein [Bacteroides sp.]
MSEQELNSYRFLGGADPTDEMLQAIMIDARDEAIRRAEEAQKKFKADYERQYEHALQIWGERIASARNGQQC